MKLTETQLQAAAKRGSRLYGKVGKLLLREVDPIEIDDPREFEAFNRMAAAVLDLMAERLNAIAEVAEVAGPDPEALVVLLTGMVAPPSRKTAK